MAVTIHAMRNVDGDKLFEYDFCGLSTDSKPTTWGGRDIEVNSMFLELDTGDFYYLESTAIQGKTILVEEQSFELDGEEFAPLQAEVFNNVPITVVFDGVEYVCDEAQHDTKTEEDFIYGGWDNGNFDYSVFPFVLMTDPNGVSSSEYDVAVYVDDDDQHTIEVYVDGSTPAVWKKIGSGGGDSGDGYEITNPILTLNITGEPISIDEAYYVDEDGYLTDGSISSAIGETKVVVVDEDEWYGIVIPEPTSYSNEVNCTAEVEYATLIITITDPTQDASIDVAYEMV